MQRVCDSHVFVVNCVWRKAMIFELLLYRMPSQGGDLFGSERHGVVSRESLVRWKARNKFAPWHFGLDATRADAALRACV